jgi:type I restriction enzyme S subunit
MMGTKTVELTHFNNTSWKLPEGWEWVPLGTITNVIMGQSPPGKSYNSEGKGLPFFQGKAEFGDLLPTPVKWCTEAKKISQPGDVLISVRAPVGPTNMTREESCIGRGLAAIRPGDGLNTKYLLYALRVLENSLSKEGTGSTFGAIGKKLLSDFAIPVPRPIQPSESLQIQRRIVAQIEAPMAEIKKARQILIGMRLDGARVIEAALEEVFGNIRYGFKVKEVPKAQIKHIGDVTKIERGKFSHRPRNDPQFFGGKMPWVQIQNIPKDYGKHITTHMDKLNERGFSISKMFPKGTLVLSIAATIGAVGVLDFDACFPDSLVGISPDPNLLDSGFLYWQFCFIREHLERIAPAAAQKNINLQILSQLSLWVPLLREQQSINGKLDGIKIKVQEMLKSANRDAQLLDRLEQSILERAFRGEL